MIDDLPCAVCHLSDTDVNVSTDYNGSALLRLKVSYSCNNAACRTERSYVTSLNHIRE